MTPQSLRYRVARALPTPIVDYLRKHYRRRRAAQRQKTRRETIALHGQFDAVELLDVLRGMGIAQGSVVFVQASFNDMHTFTGRPIDLLQALRTLVGPTGTLMMPAYSAAPTSASSAVMEIARAPTYTGIVNELFRRSPGVVRSVHPRHSICAEGPLATMLLAGHEDCVFADGKGSPFDRLRQRNDALILTIGLAPGFTSFLHWIEDLEPDRLPRPVHEPVATRQLVRHPDGRTVEVRDMHLRPEVGASLDLTRIASRLTEHEFRVIRHRGIDFGLYAVKPFSEKLVALRDSGIFHYH